MLGASGFTIVEVLVALLVLVIGLFGTLSTLSAAYRRFEDSHSSIVASAHAAELLESLRGDKCGESVAGSQSTRSLSYFWTTEQISYGLRRVTVVVSSARLRSRVDTFSAVLPC
jgi:type IV pilus modification protein PilV